MKPAVSPTHRLMLFIMAAMLAMLGACATQPATFADKAAVASATITWATLAADSLAKQGKINRKQATDALTASKAGSAALDTAQDLNSKGDLTGAEAALAMSTTILQAVKTFLVSNGATAP